jgi:hypothetical protein
MSKVTLPIDISRQLSQAQSCVELCDASGQTIGYFTPAIASLDEPYISEEELARRANEEPLYTTEEVLDYLRKL